jgi:hypothetical protein
MRAPVTFRSFPTSAGEHRGWIALREIADATRVETDARTVVTDLAATLQGYLWVAHARELAAANDILMGEVEKAFHQVSCGGDGEGLGFTCWQRRRP